MTLVSEVIGTHFSALSRAVEHLGPETARLTVWGQRLADVLTGGGRLLARQQPAVAGCWRAATAAAPRKPSI